METTESTYTVAGHTLTVGAVYAERRFDGIDEAGRVVLTDLTTDGRVHGNRNRASAVRRYQPTSPVLAAILNRAGA